MQATIFGALSLHGEFAGAAEIRFCFLGKIPGATQSKIHKSSIQVTHLLGV
jgi:hypothetical protein